MGFVLFSLLFWTVLQIAESDFDVGKINCRQNVPSVQCPWNTTCSGTCRYTCADIQQKENDPARQIWGTKTYTYYSSICKAATHDLRVTEDNNQRTFLLKRIPYDENYWASIRSGIRSYSLLNLSSPEEGSFIFLSPKVKENILDVASIHEKFLFRETEFHVQRCLASKDSTSFSFENLFPELRSSLSGEAQTEHYGNLVINKMHWPNLDGEAQTGGFLCVPQDSTLSVVTSLAMSANADFYPTHMTYVANVNENVTLIMEEHSDRSSSCTYQWKKDGEELPKFVRQSVQQRTSLFLPRVEEGSQGLYSLECDLNSNRRGVLRLIVRACPADKYGDNCTEQCPECKNGGVCHDITGVCICPPGFNGKTCEKACPPGYFGQTCKMSCPEEVTSQGNSASCKGYLICFPDPYGCSCASGYKGIACNESFPVLTDEISLIESTSSSITLSFREWDPNLDIGSGTPSTYKVFYKRNTDEETWVSKDVIAVSAAEKGRYDVTLENLASDTEYVVRVVILDVSGRSQEENVKEHVFSTSCGTPMEPPLNIKLSATEEEVSIVWDLPEKKFWNCRTVKSFVKYNSLEISEGKLTSQTSYSFTSEPFTKWNITICLGQRNESVKCAETKNVTTREAAPEAVRDFSSTSDDSRSIYLTWKQPLKKNGIIRYFILHYFQTAWNHECSEKFDTTRHVLNISHVNTTSTTVSDLNPSAVYSFSLAAATVKEGPVHVLTVVTDIDVPSGRPRELRFTPTNKTSLEWREPLCAKSNGRIKNYRIIITGLSAEDKYQRNHMTNKQYFVPFVLASTTYNAKVFASTEAGIGELYAELNFTTPEKEKTVLDSLEVTQTTENSISIAWTPSVYTRRRDIPVIYEVTLFLLERHSMANVVYSSENEQPLIRHARGRQYTIQNLQPATVYYLGIAALRGNTRSSALSMIVRTRISVPKGPRVPEFLDKTENTITVKIFPVEPSDPMISFYFLVIKVEQAEGDKGTELNYQPDENFFAPSNCHLFLHGDRYVAARWESIPLGGRDFTVGDGRCIEGYSNAQLVSGTYQIGIAVVSQYLGEKSYSRVSYMPEKITVGKSSKADVYPIVLGVLITLVVIVFILIVIFAMPSSFLQKAQQTASQSVAMLPWRRRSQPAPARGFDNITLENDSDGDDIDTEPTAEDISHVIAVKDLENYITENLSNGELKKQFKAIPRSHVYSCRAARLPDNKVKNRYGNLLPYDHSRVKLKSTPDSSMSSEYINANYVCGYKCDKKYVATQGPLSKTVADFWRMIWQEKCCKIFMVTNLMEQGRVKCEKYWPDETAVFGSLTVTLKNSEPLADYVIRTFEISSGKHKRELNQYHYLTWPDHGAPSSTVPVIRLLRRAKDYQPNNGAPIVVHCSAGVGRTGAIILLDSMLEMGTVEGKIDVCGHLCEMRKKRINLLENMEQYLFIYKALEEAFCWGETSIPCADLVPQIGKLRKPDPDTCFTPLEVQYQRLGKICPLLDNVSVRVARLPENVPKNRTMNVLPPERARPILNETSEGIPYINAVYINGYKEKDAFLVTQYPLPNTIHDFWKMIYEEKSRTIILLQDIDFSDSACPQYWPSEGQTVVHDEYRIQCISVESYGDMRIWNFSLSFLFPMDSSDESPIPVKLFHHLNWSIGKLLPEYPNSILDLIDQVEREQRANKHVVTVQCLNGSTACGVFCASTFVCSKMKYEQEVDIFLAVENVRTNRPQFIETFEQYDFLGDMAITFLDNFGAYANFL